MDDDLEVVSVLREWMEALTIRSMDALMSYARASELSLPQLHLVMFLYHGGSCGVRDIGARMEMSSPAASQMIERLVQAGLLERAEDPDDRRVRQIALTEKGRQLAECGIAERYRWLDALVAELDDAERRAVLTTLPALTAAQKRLPLRGPKGLPGERQAAGPARGKAPLP
jgi:DNA-binding MarR family transcriptional regulator